MNWNLEKPMLDDDPELESAHKVLDEISKFVIGKRNVLEHVLIALFSNGHVLFEDYPGLAKTLIARSLAQATGCLFRRVQFTPDLLPADIIGTYVLNRTNYKFELRKGPIFTNILLADEINRAPPRTQSALLEAMQERQVTIENETLKLADPFIVLATQNPIEYEGTYPLPESQLDRFLMRIRIGYPDASAERNILRQTAAAQDRVRSVISGEQLIALQDSVAQISVDDDIVDYMLKIVEKTRSHESLAMGVSPRGAQALYRAAQALAAVEGRDYVTPDDVKRLVVPVFAHRVVVNTRMAIAQRSAEVAEKILSEILTLVDVPL